MQRIIDDMGSAMALTALFPRAKRGDFTHIADRVNGADRYQSASGQWYERQPDGSVRRLKTAEVA